jgi:small subunit ribosomal protein S15e
LARTAPVQRPPAATCLVQQAGGAQCSSARGRQCALRRAPPTRLQTRSFVFPVLHPPPDTHLTLLPSSPPRSQQEAIKRKRIFKKFTYRGVDLEKLLDMGNAEVIELLPARIRRRFARGLTRKHTTLLKKLRKAKRDVKPMEKPATIKTHLRNMPILPEMVGALVAVYNGKVFNIVEIKPEMIGKYLAEFSITYKPTLHGRPGLGATHSSRFIPLK